MFYSQISRAEGYPTLEEVFLITSDNERGHGEVFFDFLTEGLSNTILEPQVLVPVSKGNIPENLLAAAQGEYEEWSNLYPSFARTAKDEGFDQIANAFFSIAEVEKRHDMRFRDLLERYETETLFHTQKDVVWECLNCGYQHTGPDAPEICPACLHKQQFYKIVSASIL